MRDRPDSWSLFLTHEDSELRGWRDLDGRTIAFQEPHSTTGYLLPAMTLIDHGYQLEAVSGPTIRTRPGQVGYFFTGDEENSVQLLVGNLVAAAVISIQDWDELPEELKRPLRIIDKTPSVPRQLVAVRPGMDSEMVASVRRILLDLTDEDRARLAAEVEGGGWTWRFDELQPAELDRLEDYSERLALFAGD